MIGFPFDSHVTHGEDGQLIFDRAISSKPMRKLIGELFSNGVLPNPSTNLQVFSADGMKIKVKTGFCMINGLMKYVEFDKTLTLQKSDAQENRIDSVVMRLNTSDKVRSCDLYILTGKASGNPLRPTLTREESIFEIGLADIFVDRGVTKILPNKISDTRYETGRCGIVSSISEFDTSTLYQQIKSDLKYFRDNEQQDFTIWKNAKQIEYDSWTTQKKEEFKQWYDSLKDLFDDDFAKKIVQKLEEIKTVLDNHEKSIVWESGVHGMRYSNDMLQVKSRNSEWADARAIAKISKPVIDTYKKLGMQ